MFYSRSGAAFSVPIVAGNSGGATIGTTRSDRRLAKATGRSVAWRFTFGRSPFLLVLPAEQAADRLRRADRSRSLRAAINGTPVSIGHCGAGLDPDHAIHPFGLAVLSSLPPARRPGLPRPDRRRLACAQYRPDTNAGRLEERAMGPDPRFRLQRFGIPASLPQQRRGFHRPDLVRFERRSDRDAESGRRVGGELGAVRGSVLSLRGPSLRTGQRLGRQTVRALLGRDRRLTRRPKYQAIRGTAAVRERLTS